jgi:hypothetical protein
MEDGGWKVAILDPHPPFSIFRPNGVIPRVPLRADKVSQVKRACDNSHGVADLLLPCSRVDTPLYLLLTRIDSTRKKIYLDLRNLRLCVVRPSGGMSIALDEGQ